MLKANIQFVSLNTFCVTCFVRRFSEARITKEQKKNIFWLIKNEDKIVGDHLSYIFIT